MLENRFSTSPVVKTGASSVFSNSEPAPRFPAAVREPSGRAALPRSVDHPAQGGAQPDLTREELVRRARASIAACEQLFAETGITPDSCLEAVRRSAGAAVARKVQSDVDGIVRAVRDQAEREASHASPGHIMSRRVALRGGV